MATTSPHRKTLQSSNSCPRVAIRVAGHGTTPRLAFYVIMLSQCYVTAKRAGQWCVAAYVQTSYSLRRICNELLFFALATLVSVSCVAQPHSSTQICPRPAAGATIFNPPELQSRNGKLEVTLHLRYQQTSVSEGPPRYCYITDDGIESPTLRVRPGDELVIHLHNDLAPSADGTFESHEMMPRTGQGDCLGSSMDLSTTNLHFHGMTIPPTCHQDEVIRTAVHAGQEFDYFIKIPSDEQPGLYWYHPHPHGFGERQVQGGASGAIIVEGIESAISYLASYSQRVIVLRD